MRFTAGTTDLLPSYADLLRLAVQLQLVPAQQAKKINRTVLDKDARRVLASAVELREALAAIFYAWVDERKPPARQVELLERQFHAAAAHRHLHAGARSLQWNWAAADQAADLPLWMLAQSAADLLVSRDAHLVKDCGDPTCRWLFLDLSKNHTRRWCDMKICGNRMKARRHQARLEETPL